MVEIGIRLLYAEDLPNMELNTLMANPSTKTELKIGISAGRFLGKLAAGYEDSLFVGIELKPQSSRLAARFISNKKLKNVVVVNIEALEYIKKWVSDSSFYAVHIYFPTPYPSAINLPDRLIRQDFVEEVYRILKPWGTLRIVTDHRDYYEEVCTFFDSRHWWAVSWQPLSIDIPNGYYVGTSHEVKYREAASTIYALQLIRTAEDC